MQKQFKPMLLKKDLLIENSKYSSYSIGNLRLSQLNLVGGKIPSCL